MNNFQPNMLVTLKDFNWVSRQRIAGKCVARVLKHLDSMILDATPNLSLLDMDAEAERIILEEGCTPTFKGYKGFPGAVCLSVNKDMVHGIPTKYVLQDGDIVKFDLGATFQGAIADAASTRIYGNPKHEKHVRLVNTTLKALNNGIKAAGVGKRIGAIGYAIHKSIGEFGNITNYGGHGLDENQPHAAPFVANKGQPTEGVRMQAGMTIAIEPMLVIGSTETRIQEDGWTVSVNDMSAHMEHTIFIHEDRVEVMTEWDRPE